MPTRQRAVEAIAVAVLDQQSGFERVFGEFLDEQRHAVRLGGDLRHNFGGQPTPGCRALDQGLDLAMIKAPA